MPRQSASTAAFLAGTSTRIAPPPELNALERAEFTSLVLAMPADHFTAADIPTVAMYARAVVAERRSAGELDAAPIVDGRPSPWLVIWQSQIRAVTTLGRRLRLNPAGLQPTKTAAKDRQSLPISYYDKVRLEAGLDDAN